MGNSQKIAAKFLLPGDKIEDLMGNTVVVLAQKFCDDHIIICYANGKMNLPIDDEVKLFRNHIL